MQHPGSKLEQQFTRQSRGMQLANTRISPPASGHQEHYLAQRRSIAIVYDDFAQFVTKINKLQAVAEALTAPDHSVDLDFSGRIRKRQFKQNAGANGQRMGYIRAHSTLAERVGPSKRGDWLIIQLAGGFQAHVNLMTAPAPLFRPRIRLGHLKLSASSPLLH
jgi:hypothetical protein